MTERDATPDEAFELGRVAGWDELFDQIEPILRDLESAYPGPSPYTTESTVIERLRAALLINENEHA